MASNMKDFATGIVDTAPSPATSGTSLTLQSGQGARMPATPFYAVAHPPAEMPTTDNAEKILVTNVSSDTLTITRAQDGTTAQSIESGWRLTNALFLRDLSQLRPFTEVTITTGASTAAKVGTTSGGSYSPQAGDILQLNFSNSNTANSATLNVDGSGAANIQTGGVNTSNVSLSGTKVLVWYDGTNYQLFGSQRVSDTDTNTTYSEITTAEIDAGTATTLRSISGRRADYIAQKAIAAVAADSNIVRRDDSSVSGASWLSSSVSTATDKATTPNAVKTYVEGIFATLLPVGAKWYGGNNSANPSTYIPGMSGTTWVATNVGRSPIGIDSGDTDFDTAGETGGAKTHTLTWNQMPSHTHDGFRSGNVSQNGRLWFGEGGSTSAGNDFKIDVDDIDLDVRTTGSAGTQNIDIIGVNAAGGGEAHNNMHPYQVEYIWLRTA